MQCDRGVRWGGRVPGADRAWPCARSKGVGDRLAASGELAGADALYASVLPRAIETAGLLAPALGAAGPGSEPVPPLEVVTECGLCELHPGDADGLTWSEFTDRFGTLNWDVDPGQPIAPHGESWTGFVQPGVRITGQTGRRPSRAAGGGGLLRRGDRGVTAVQAPRWPGASTGPASNCGPTTPR